MQNSQKYSRHRLQVKDRRRGHDTRREVASRIWAVGRSPAGFSCLSPWPGNPSVLLASSRAVPRARRLPACARRGVDSRPLLGVPCGPGCRVWLCSLSWLRVPLSYRAAKTGGRRWTCAGASSRRTAKATARAGCPPATPRTPCRYSPFGRRTVLWFVVTGGWQAPRPFVPVRTVWDRKGISASGIQSVCDDSAPPLSDGTDVNCTCHCAQNQGTGLEGLRAGLA